jgi:hypothetical protein
LRFRPKRDGDTTGLDPLAPYSWTLLLHHNIHVHTVLSEDFHDELLLDIPTRAHDLGSPLWYEVRLAMHTDTGQILQSALTVKPQTTTLQVQSWPAPARITLDQQERDPDELTTVIVGQAIALDASATIIYDQKVGKFKNWVVTESWPTLIAAERPQTEAAEIIPHRHYTLVVPATAMTYVAFYEYVGPAMLNYLPTLHRDTLVQADATLADR